MKTYSIIVNGISVGELDAIGIIEARKIARQNWPDSEVIPAKAGRKLSQKRRHNLIRGAYIHAAQLRGIFTEDKDDDHE